MSVLNGKFTIGATDGAITITADLEDTNEEFKTAVIDRTKLLKLLKFTNSENVVLNRKDGYVELKGNGKYKLEVSTENDEEIELPLNIPEVDSIDNKEEVNLYKLFMKRNSFAINENATEMFYRYCTMDGKTITSDARVLSITTGELIDDELPPKLVSIISTFDSGVFQWKKLDTGYLIVFDTIKVFYGMDKFERLFPVKGMAQYLDLNNFKYYAKVNVKELLSALQRLDVVKTIYDEPFVTFNFTKEVLTLKDMRGVGTETIEVQSDIVGENDKLMSINNLSRVLKVLENEVELYLGDKFIALKDSLGFIIVAQAKE